MPDIKRLYEELRKISKKREGEKNPVIIDYLNYRRDIVLVKIDAIWKNTEKREIMENENLWDDVKKEFMSMSSKSERCGNHDDAVLYICIAFGITGFYLVKDRVMRYPEEFKKARKRRYYLYRQGWRIRVSYQTIWKKSPMDVFESIERRLEKEWMDQEIP